MLNKRLLYRLFLPILVVGAFCFSQAQDVGRARGVVETLALPFFHGRGYVNSGDSLAAEFIAKEFKLLGLNSVSDGYFQLFSFSVNTFPGKMRVRYGRKLLVPGKDYLLHPASSGSGLSGKGKVIKQKISRKDGNWLLKNQRKNTLPERSVTISEKEKLTFGVSTRTEPGMHLILKKGILNNSASAFKVIAENKYLPDHKARNVIGYIEGTVKKDSFLVITAHYDHLGQLGADTYFPGANDNASGTAMMLELAHYYADSTHRLPYSILFIAFAGEEAGLLGSQYYVQHPMFPLEKIKFLVNLDLLGSGKDGITIVNGSVYTKQFAVIDSLNKVSKGISHIVARGKAANSDHYPFSENGVPSFFIYTLGEITAYHDIDDKPDVVTFSRFKEIFSLLNQFLKSF